MFNVRLAGGLLYGKRLFTWLSLMVSLMASFVLSFFPLDVLDEIWNLIESVSEGFLTYSYFSMVFPKTELFINLYMSFSKSLLPELCILPDVWLHLRALVEPEGTMDLSQTHAQRHV